MTPRILLFAVLAGPPGQAAIDPPATTLVLSGPAYGAPEGAGPRIDERDPSTDRAPSLALARSGQLRPAPAGAAPDALSGAELDTLVGGDAGVAAAVSNQHLEAVNTGNRITADQVVTGSVTLDRSALSNFSGLGNIVVNTGNNNNLQSSLSLSVVMPPR